MHSTVMFSCVFYNCSELYPMFGSEVQASMSTDRTDLIVCPERSRRDTDLFVPVQSLSEKQALPTIRGYTLLRSLGRDGMGTVYEADQHAPPRRVAIKRITQDPNQLTMESVAHFSVEPKAMYNSKYCMPFSNGS